jgi:predicted Fe-Mo cluster-binding NifX family protein
MQVKVAVASKHGVAIDEHFGHAKRFRIYTVTAQGIELLEERDVDHYCLGGHGDRSALEKILDTIADCAAVFVARVGDGPAEKLMKRGIEPVLDYPWEPIDSALKAWLAQRLEPVVGNAAEVRRC